ncbi:MAG TPA: hypothetical protein VHZ55_15065 [Bryobacteraceae bacterium]|nr:hypothetical protein [Bryobacteraceae bacterium]
MIPWFGGDVSGKVNDGTPFALLSYVCKVDVGLPLLLKDSGPRLVTVKIPKPALNTVLSEAKGRKATLTRGWKFSNTDCAILVADELGLR